MAGIIDIDVDTAGVSIILSLYTKGVQGLTCKRSARGVW